MKHLVNFSCVCDSADLSYVLSILLDINTSYHAESCSVLNLIVKTVSPCNVFKPSSDGLSLDKVFEVNSVQDDKK